MNIRILSRSSDSYEHYLSKVFVITYLFDACFPSQLFLFTFFSCQKLQKKLYFFGSSGWITNRVVDAMQSLGCMAHGQHHYQHVSLLARQALDLSLLDTWQPHGLMHTPPNYMMHVSLFLTYVSNSSSSISLHGQ